jgi:hypothetical protein
VGELPAQSRKPCKARIAAAPDAKPGVHLVGLDLTMDGRRYGELFDVIVEVLPK